MESCGGPPYWGAELSIAVWRLETVTHSAVNSSELKTRCVGIYVMVCWVRTHFALLYLFFANLGLSVLVVESDLLEPDPLASVDTARHSTRGLSFIDLRSWLGRFLLVLGLRFYSPFDVSE